MYFDNCDPILIGMIAEMCSQQWILQVWTKSEREYASKWTWTDHLNPEPQGLTRTEPANKQVN